MKGHDGIIKMRMQGYKPSAIWIFDFPCVPKWEEFQDDPEVCVHGDNLNTLDLRYTVGLVVHINGDTEERAKKLLDLCVQHSASKVIACANDWIGCHGYELIE
jgi:hypothetical protein